MDKTWLVEQLASRLRQSAQTARQAMEAAVLEAREGATPSEKRESAQVAQESQGLARGHKARLDRANEELGVLEKFRPPRLAPPARVAVGAVVEVEDEGEGEGRTFFLAPVGAGIELSGPGGDGYLSVVTPASPVGRAVLGRTVGDTIEVVVEGDAREWTITYVE